MRPIDSDDLTEKIEDAIDSGKFVTASDILDMIQKMPSTEKHGKLTHVGYDCGLKIYECSMCNKRCYGKMNYCPNCGAKMDLE